MSADLVWMMIRNNHSYLVKKRNVKKPFSKEPHNLSNLNSFRYNGLIHKKMIGIEAPADNKGFTLVYKKAKASRHPAKSLVRTQMKAGPRRSLYKLKRFIRANRYRPDLLKMALRRASAVLKSQKPLPAKKGRAKKTE
ncbi:60S ribosomal protein L28 [Ischnura elegans]|uniref:60S ribosomal protein L28 n=1 Tax=Ischnura elegans TaxID=197161 RepID=UPI001ED8B053|nr:60S ribosomal protein L28 [Ischnura elegans]